MKLTWIGMLCALLPGITLAGVVVKTQRPEGVETHIYQNNMMLFLLDGQLQMSVDVKKDSCTSYNHRAKKYLRMSCKKWKQNMKSMMSNMGAAENMMQNMLPPEAKAQLEAMERMPPLTIKKVGTGEFSGYKVEKYRIMTGNETLGEYWISAKVNNLIQREFNYAKYKDILISDEDFQQGPMAKLMSKLSKKESELHLKGFVLKHMSYVNGGPQSEPEVSSSMVTVKNVNLKQFSVPKNYKPVTSMQQLMF